MSKETVESTFPVDIRFLARCKKGAYSAVLERGQSEISIAFDAPNRIVRVAWHARRRDYDHCIRLLPTRPNYGGVRWWAECPHCGRRVAILYIRFGFEFACRHCLELIHTSTRKPLLWRLQSRHQRLLSRFRKPRHEAFEEFDDFDSFDPEELLAERPRGMWHRTFERIREQSEEFEGRIGDEDRAWMLAMTRRWKMRPPKP